MRSDYSVTSNEVKLLKHLDKLQNIQNGFISPIMVHMALTNKCNMHCVHCCLAERDARQELAFDRAVDALKQFKALGTHAVEFTGGGEQTLYPDMDRLIDVAEGLGFAMGMITNAIDAERVSNWKKLAWIRVSLNAFDCQNPEKIEKFKKNVRYLNMQSHLTGCYIVSQEIGSANLPYVCAFAEEEGIPTRIAPDCVQSREQIAHQIEWIRKDLVSCGARSNVFLSDFNVYLGDRTDNFCAMHMIKPYVYSDGNVYACPSSELATENNRTMQEKFRICSIEEIYNYYTRVYETFSHSCSYCKYAAQNELLRKVMMDTQHNEFA